MNCLINVRIYSFIGLFFKKNYQNLWLRYVWLVDSTNEQNSGEKNILTIHFICPEPSCKARSINFGQFFLAFFAIKSKSKLSECHCPNRSTLIGQSILRLAIKPFGKPIKTLWWWLQPLSFLSDLCVLSAPNVTINIFYLFG